MFDTRCLEENTVVHCDTKEKAIEFTNWLDSIGKTWFGGESYITDKNWCRYREETCYTAFAGAYSSISFYKRYGYTILSFDDVKLTVPTAIGEYDHNAYIAKHKPKQPELFSDWRVPTIEELLTLVDYEDKDNACVIKDCKLSAFWSSSAYVSDSFYAWYVIFKYGYSRSNSKSYNYYVRCVRDGVSGLEWSQQSDETMKWDGVFDYAKKLTSPVHYKG